jgi:hypothetical protein
VPGHGPVQRWVCPPFTRKCTVPTLPVPDRGPDRTGLWTVPTRPVPDRGLDRTGPWTVRDCGPDRPGPDPRTGPDRPPGGTGSVFSNLDRLEPDRLDRPGLNRTVPSSILYQYPILINHEWTNYFEKKITLKLIETINIHQ